MGSACRILKAVVCRDLLVGVRGLGDVLAGIGYFAVVVALVPLALGPDPETLRQVGPAMIWIAALLAALPQTERFYSRDFADGSLDDLVLTPLALPVVVLAKVLAGWVMAGLPLLVTAPVLALMLGLPFEAMPVMVGSLAVGSAALMLLGSLAAAVSIGARRTAILVAVLILPLALPVLIFGTAATAAALRGEAAFPHLALLGATTLVLLAVAPMATAAALRAAAE